MAAARAAPVTSRCEAAAASPGSTASIHRKVSMGRLCEEGDIEDAWRQTEEEEEYLEVEEEYLEEEEITWRKRRNTWKKWRNPWR